MYQRILVPLDGSPLAEQVLAWVGILAKGMQSQVELLRVIEPPPLLLSRENVRVKCSAKMSVAYPLVGFAENEVDGFWLSLNWLEGGESNPATHPGDFGA